MTSDRLDDWEQRLLSAAALQPAQDWEVRCYTSVASTMDVARALAPELAPGRNALVLTKEQSAGRGRQGRVWESTPGGFYATYVFSSSAGSFSPEGFSLVVGVSLAEFFAALGFAVQLKWPNDVLTEQGAKLAGVLIELVGDQELRRALVGIGVNLRGVPEAIRDASIDLLTLTGREFEPVDLAAGLSPLLGSNWDDFVIRGFGPFRRRWEELAWGLGLDWEVLAGNQTVSGRCLGVSNRGALRLEVDGIMQEIVAGHVVKVGSIRC